MLGLIYLFAAALNKNILIALQDWNQKKKRCPKQRVLIVGQRRTCLKGLLTYFLGCVAKDVIVN